MGDLKQRLRAAHENSPQRIAGSNIFAEAAAALDAKDAEIERLRALLDEVLPTDAPVWFDEAEARGWACGWNDARAQIRAPVARAALAGKE